MTTYFGRGSRRNSEWILRSITGRLSCQDMSARQISKDTWAPKRRRFSRHQRQVLKLPDEVPDVKDELLHALSVSMRQAEVPDSRNLTFSKCKFAGQRLVGDWRVPPRELQPGEMHYEKGDTINQLTSLTADQCKEKPTSARSLSQIMCMTCLGLRRRKYIFPSGRKARVQTSCEDDTRETKLRASSRF